jgi:hypothetical protein
MRGAADHKTRQQIAPEENGEPNISVFGFDWPGIFILPVSLLYQAVCQSQRGAEFASIAVSRS